MHGVAAVKEAQQRNLERGLRDLFGQGGGAFAAIASVVAIPKRLPSRKVSGLDGADADVGLHGVDYASDSTLRRLVDGWRLIWLDICNDGAS
jgi:hypothetical protein